MYWVCKEAANPVATFVRLPAYRRVRGTEKEPSSSLSLPL